MNETEVGHEIEAFCAKCKTDTIHIITSSDGNMIDRVMCQICFSYHRYRQPHARMFDEPPEDLFEVEKVEPPPKKTRKKSAHKIEETWDSLLTKVNQETSVDYVMSGNYETGLLLNHRKFGPGIIRSIVSENKIEVLFQDGLKVLVQNYTEQ
jgi:hypothetical protein